MCQNTGIEFDNVDIGPVPQRCNPAVSPYSGIPTQSPTEPVSVPTCPQLDNMPADENVTITRAGRVVRPPSRMDL